MEYLLIAFIWVLNFAISVWNAYACGKVWAESKMAGGFVRFMVWMGAVMSACGFSWCYLIFGALALNFWGQIDQQELMACLNAGYVMLAPVILFACYAITLDSWVQAWRQRDLPSMGIAAWNTFATIHNSYDIISNYGSAFRNALGYFTGFFSGSSDKDDDDNLGLIIVVGVLIGALIGGAVTTMAIIYKVAASTPLPDYVRNREDT